MRLVPREQDKLMLHYAGMLARDRKAQGLKLNYPEAVAYISMEVMEKARAGASAAEHRLWSEWSCKRKNGR